MEDLLEIAQIYYNSSSSELKELAQNFFKSLDVNGDGKVSLYEFLELMKNLGHTNLSNRHFFKELDRDGNGSLEFNEVIGLYYIIKSGRPFCGGCDSFIPGMFFTCNKCFDNDAGKPFCVCSSCFGNGEFIHKHGSNHFLDNFALLEATRKEAVATKMATQANRAQASSSVTITELPPSAYTSTSTAIVPYNSSGEKPWMLTLRLLEFGLNAFAAMSNCSIM